MVKEIYFSDGNEVTMEQKISFFIQFPHLQSGPHYFYKTDKCDALKEAAKMVFGSVYYDYFDYYFQD